MNLGNGPYNLDLSLGISTTRNGSNDTGDFGFRNTTGTGESSASVSVGVQPEHCQTIASKHPPMLSNVCPAVLLPYNEVLLYIPTCFPFCLSKFALNDVMT